MDNEYEIGYGKPPKDQQFKKGASGNPNGRPKGSKNTYTLLQEILNQNLEVVENSKTINISKKAAMLLQLVNKGVKGDIKAITALLPHMLSADAKEEETQKIMESLHRDDAAIIERYIQSLRGDNNG